jgi:hypothetical protein
MKWWQLIDAFKDGPAAWWRDELAGDFAAAKPFLRPSDKLSPAFPCQHSSTTGCAFEVVTKPAGEIVGICREDRCERRNFTRADLATYSVDGAALAGALAIALNLDQQVEKIPDVPWAWLAGFEFPTMGFRFPVLLALPDAQDSPEQIIAQLVARHEKPILVLPTKRGLTTAVERMLADRGCGLVVLDGAVGFSPDGKLLIGEAANHALSEFRAKHVPVEFGPTIPTFFPTPPTAGWGDLTIKFSTGHDARFAFRDGPSRILSFTHLGMIDERSSNKPTKAWELLRVFSEREGTLIPKNQIEQKAIEKQKGTLSKNLRDFFRLKDEPIPWDYSVNGWVCRFKRILPIGAET